MIFASREYGEIRAISKFQPRNFGGINAQISSELERRFLAILKVARSSFRIAKNIPHSSVDGSVMAGRQSLV